MRGVGAGKRRPVRSARQRTKLHHKREGRKDNPSMPGAPDNSAPNLARRPSSSTAAAAAAEAAMAAPHRCCSASRARQNGPTRAPLVSRSVRDSTGSIRCNATNESGGGGACQQRRCVGPARPSWRPSPPDWRPLAANPRQAQQPSMGSAKFGDSSHAKGRSI